MRFFLALLPALLVSTVALAGGSGGGLQIPVPEPASIALLIGGVGALIGVRARRR